MRLKQTRHEGLPECFLIKCSWSRIQKALLKRLIIPALSRATYSFFKSIASTKKDFNAKRLTLSYFFPFPQQVIHFRLPECILIKCSCSRIHGATQ